MNSLNQNGAVSQPHPSADFLVVPMLDRQIEIPLFQQVLLHDGSCPLLKPQLANKSLILAAVLYKGIPLQEINYVTLEAEAQEGMGPVNLGNPRLCGIQIESLGARIGLSHCLPGRNPVQDPSPAPYN